MLERTDLTPKHKRLENFDTIDIEPFSSLTNRIWADTIRYRMIRATGIPAHEAIA